ncbi:MAG: hypothetical protein M1833_001853 [Piccolia ochrophora]|nr:MAG: hypothetical protein M1833_001853 [Piccolia ochrophora]
MTSNTLGLARSLLPVTGTWAAPFAIYMALLSVRVSILRDEHKQTFGDRLTGSRAPSGTTPETDPLYLAVRTHANYAENVPMVLVLAALAELNGGRPVVLSTILGVFFVMRVLHAEAGILAKGKKSMGPGRFIGASLTLLTTISLGAYSAWLSRDSWGLLIGR